MATTRDYTDYLNDQVDIAPVNSLEEQQAAEVIERLFVQHGLETHIQEFDASSMAGISTRIYLILLFVGMLLSGFLGTVVSIVGLVLVILSFVLILLARRGTDLLTSIGPQVRSQNVIGVHRATGPNVVKGSRPIVIVAHYDTPRENFLYRRQFAQWQPIIKRLSWPFSIAVLVLALFQPIPLIPVAVRHVFWVIGVLLALPLLLLAAASIYERFAACTTGANDNKASIAAMLGVLDMVRPADDDAKEWAATHPMGVRRSLEEELEEEIYGDEDEKLPEEEYEQDEYYDEPLDEPYDEEPVAERMANDHVVADEHAPEDDVALDEPAGPVEEEIDEPVDEEEEEYLGEAYEDEDSFEDEYGLEYPSTVRRGASVMKSLKVLPTSCEIVYENLTPRDEVIERIEAERAEEFEDEFEGGLSKLGGAAGGIGQAFLNGLYAARDGAARLFEAIRDFFVGVFERFSGEKNLPEIERAEVEIVETPESMAADSADNYAVDVDEEVDEGAFDTRFDDELEEVEDAQPYEVLQVGPYAEAYVQEIDEVDEPDNGAYVQEVAEVDAPYAEAYVQEIDEVDEPDSRAYVQEVAEVEAPYAEATAQEFDEADEEPVVAPTVDEVAAPVDTVDYEEVTRTESADARPFFTEDELLEVEADELGDTNISMPVLTDLTMPRVDTESVAPVAAAPVQKASREYRPFGFSVSTRPVETPLSVMVPNVEQPVVEQVAEAPVVPVAEEPRAAVFEVEYAIDRAPLTDAVEETLWVPTVEDAEETDFAPEVEPEFGTTVEPEPVLDVTLAPELVELEPEMPAIAVVEPALDVMAEPETTLYTAPEQELVAESELEPLVTSEQEASSAAAETIQAMFAEYETFAESIEEKAAPYEVAAEPVQDAFDSYEPEVEPLQEGVSSFDEVTEPAQPMAVLNDVDLEDDPIDVEADALAAEVALWTPSDSDDDTGEPLIVEREELVEPQEEVIEEAYVEAVEPAAEPSAVEEEILEPVIDEAPVVESFEAEPVAMDEGFAEELPVVEETPAVDDALGATDTQLHVQQLFDEELANEELDELVFEEDDGLESLFSSRERKSGYNTYLDAEYELIDEDEGDTFVAGVPVEVVDVPSMGLGYEIPGLTPSDQFYRTEERVEEPSMAQAETVDRVAQWYAAKAAASTLVAARKEEAADFVVVTPAAEDVVVTLDEPVLTQDEPIDEMTSTSDADFQSFVETMADSFALEDEEVAPAEELVAVEEAAPENAESLVEEPLAEWVQEELVEEGLAQELQADNAAIDDELAVVEEVTFEEPVAFEASAITDDAAAEAVAETFADEFVSDADQDVVIEEAAPEEEQVPEIVEVEIETPAAESAAPEEDALSEEPLDSDDKEELVDGLWPRKPEQSEVIEDEPQHVVADIDEELYDAQYEEEPTLQFRALTPEQVEANRRATAEPADPSAILHQLFTSAPVQGRYTMPPLPKQEDVLHQMFETLPAIEPMAAPVVEPEVVEVAEEVVQGIEEIQVEEPLAAESQAESLELPLQESAAEAIVMADEADQLQDAGELDAVAEEVSEVPAVAETVEQEEPELVADVEPEVIVEHEVELDNEPVFDTIPDAYWEPLDDAADDEAFDEAVVVATAPEEDLPVAPVIEIEEAFAAEPEFEVASEFEPILDVAVDAEPMTTLGFEVVTEPELAEVSEEELVAEPESVAITEPVPVEDDEPEPLVEAEAAAIPEVEPELDEEPEVDYSLGEIPDALWEPLTDTFENDAVEEVVEEARVIEDELPVAEEVSVAPVEEEPEEEFDTIPDALWEPIVEDATDELAHVELSEAQIIEEHVPVELVEEPVEEQKSSFASVIASIFSPVSEPEAEPVAQTEFHVKPEFEEEFKAAEEVAPEVDVEFEAQPVFEEEIDQQEEAETESELEIVDEVEPALEPVIDDVVEQGSDSEPVFDQIPDAIWEPLEQVQDEPELASAAEIEEVQEEPVEASEPEQAEESIVENETFFAFDTNDDELDFVDKIEPEQLTADESDIDIELASAEEDEVDDRFEPVFDQVPDALWEPLEQVQEESELTPAVEIEAVEEELIETPELEQVEEPEVEYELDAEIEPVVNSDKVHEAIIEPEVASEPEIELVPMAEPVSVSDIQIEAAIEPEAESVAEIKLEETTEPEAELIPEVEPKLEAGIESETELEAEIAAELEPATEAEIEPEPASVSEPASAPAPKLDPYATQLMPGLTFSSETDRSDEELADIDVTGLTMISREAEADVEDSLPVIQERMPRPRAVEDPNWGKSSYKPPVVSAGRRAMLLDLPDPSVIADDPFGSTRSGDTESMKSTAVSDEVARRFEVLRRVPSPLDEPGGGQASTSQGKKSTSQQMQKPTAQASQQQKQAASKNSQPIGSRAPKKNSKRKMRFGRKPKNQDEQVESMGEWLGLGEDYDAKKDGRQIGSWDNFDDEQNRGKWKGGATVRAGLRDDDGYDEPRRSVPGMPNFDSLDLQPVDEQDYVEPMEPLKEEPAAEMDPELMEDLREAVLRLGDDDIIAHDIWFVSTGASTRDHAGMKAFLDSHRKDIRGAFLVNLDSVGAGELKVLTNEGSGEKHRANRRLVRTLGNIAEALGINLGRADYSFDETDATPALQKSMRVSTIMGMTPDGLPARSHTSDDEPEYLNDQQIVNVADIVAELIRQS